MHKLKAAQLDSLSKPSTLIHSCPMSTEYDSDDSVSLTSTVGSDPDADQVYAVECILAQKPGDDGESRYLVKWDGYPIERATWEPIDHFDDKNTVNEWLGRKAAGAVPDFDWKQWDKDREMERKAQAIRKARREKKRRHLGYYKKVRKKSHTRSRDDLEGRLAGFVVDDDEIEEESEVSETSIGEDVSRKRKHESEASDDSLMVSLKRRQDKKRTKSSEIEDKFKDIQKLQKIEKKLEKRKRRPSPSESLHRETSKLFIGMKPGPAKRSKKEVVKKPGPSAKVPGPAKLFTTLSRINRANKAGRNEPPPDPNQLELFKPGNLKPEPLRRLSLQSPITETFSETLRKPILQPITTNTASATGLQETESPPYASKIGSATSGRPLPTPSIIGSPSVDAMDFAFSNPTQISPVSSKEQPSFQRTFGRENTSIATGPREYECRIVVGPPSAKLDLGSATLQGLSGNFIDFLIQKQITSLFFDKFLLQDYIEVYLAPSIDRTLETAEVIIDGDKVQPVMNCLTFMKGAAIMIHENFTMIAFHKTTDKIRDAFKIPRLSGNKKAYLRLAVIPPLAVDYELSSEEISPLLSTVDYSYYIHTLLCDLLGFNFDDILQKEKEKTRKRGESLFIVYCPENSLSESLEIQYALMFYNKKVIDAKEVAGRMSQGARFTALIHQSLRRQLHLLPHIARLQAHDCNFYLFGTKIENGFLTYEPVRIWGMGRVIFVTPQLVISNTQLWEHCVAYQKSKDSTTRIALPTTWKNKFEESYRVKPTERLAKAIYDIRDMISKGKVLEIEVEEYPDCDEVEVMLDRFAFFQLENCTLYRQFAFAHLEIPGSCILKQPLYTNLQIYHIGNLVEHLPLSKLASAKTAGKQDSEITSRN